MFGELFAQTTTPPSAYTTYYRLRMWSQGARASADSLNQNWRDLDNIIYNGQVWLDPRYFDWKDTNHDTVTIANTTFGTIGFAAGENFYLPYHNSPYSELGGGAIGYSTGGWMVMNNTSGVRIDTFMTLYQYRVYKAASEVYSGAKTYNGIVTFNNTVTVTGTSTLGNTTVNGLFSTYDVAAFLYGTGLSYAPDLTQNVYYKLNPVATAQYYFGSTVTADTITVTIAGNYYISASFSLSGTSGDACTISVFVNGVEKHNSIKTMTGNIDIISVNSYVGLAIDDDVSFRVKNTTNGNDFTFSNVNIYLRRNGMRSGL